MIYVKLLLFICFMVVGALILRAAAEAGYDPTLVLFGSLLLLMVILRKK